MNSSSYIEILDKESYLRFSKLEVRSISKLNDRYISYVGDNILIIKYSQSIIWGGLFDTEYESEFSSRFFMIAVAKSRPSILRLINFMKWTNVDYYE